jgi:hypothetical protein
VTIVDLVGESAYRHIWRTIQKTLQGRQQKDLWEELSFYVFRTDTNAVLARGIQGYEAAKEKANALRKSQGLKWDQVKFKAERQVPKQFGVSPDGRTFTNASGNTGRVDYAPRYNPSKGRRFRGYTDSQGNYHDID